jgi:hypothetical protein
VSIRGSPLLVLLLDRLVEIFTAGNVWAKESLKGFLLCLVIRRGEIDGVDFQRILC